MPILLLKAASFFILGMAIMGLATGRVLAGSRGLAPNYYTKKDNPFLYYGFIGVYLLMGLFLLVIGF